MTVFRLTQDAKTDLIEIRRYTLKHRGKEQSKKYLAELRQTLQLISESPKIGKKRPDVGSGVHSFAHASHVIYYLVTKQQLIVFCVLHQSMLPLSHLEERSIT